MGSPVWVVVCQNSSAEGGSSSVMLEGSGEIVPSLSSWEDSAAASCSARYLSYLLKRRGMVRNPASGTGSYPAGEKGLQRRIRHRVRVSPAKVSAVATATASVLPVWDPTLNSYVFAAFILNTFLVAFGSLIVGAGIKCQGL